MKKMSVLVSQNKQDNLVKFSFNKLHLSDFSEFRKAKKKEQIVFPLILFPNFKIIRFLLLKNEQFLFS